MYYTGNESVSSYGSTRQGATVRKRLFKSPPHSTRQSKSSRTTMTPLHMRQPNAANSGLTTPSVRPAIDPNFFTVPHTPAPSARTDLSTAARRRPSTASITSSTPATLTKRTLVTNSAASDAANARLLAAWFKYTLSPALSTLPSYATATDANFLKTLDGFFIIFHSRYFSDICNLLARDAALVFRSDIHLTDPQSTHRSELVRFIARAYHYAWLIPALAALFGFNIAADLDVALHAPPNPFKTSTEGTPFEGEPPAALTAFIHDVLTAQLLCPRDFAFNALCPPADERAHHTRVLQRVLQLIVLLDQAKTSPTVSVHADPPLFGPRAPAHTSRGVVAAFTQQFLAPGCEPLRPPAPLAKHIRIIHTDPPADRALGSEDLRDGLRLCKLAALLCRKNDVLHKAAVLGPGITQRDLHTVRMDNAGLALQELSKASGFASQWAASPRDIADGRHPQTTDLAWQVISLAREILLRPVSDALDAELEAVSDAFRKHARHTSRLSQSPTEDCTLREVPSSVRSPSELDIYEHPSSQTSARLLRWAAIVCGLYGMRIRDYTESFRDGCALCLILHHYYPEVVPLKRIVHVDLVETAASAPERDHARRNFELFTTSVHTLGHFPAISLDADAAFAPSFTKDKNRVFGRVIELVVSHLFLLIARQRAADGLAADLDDKLAEHRAKVTRNTAARTIARALRRRRVANRVQHMDAEATVVETRPKTSSFLRSPVKSRAPEREVDPAPAPLKPSSKKVSPFSGPKSYQKYINKEGRTISPRLGISSEDPINIDKQPATKPPTPKQKIDPTRDPRFERSVMLVQACGRGYLVRRDFLADLKNGKSSSLPEPDILSDVTNNNVHIASAAAVAAPAQTKSPISSGGDAVAESFDLTFTVLPRIQKQMELLREYTQRMREHELKMDTTQMAQQSPEVIASSRQQVKDPAVRPVTAAPDLALDSVSSSPQSTVPSMQQPAEVQSPTEAPNNSVPPSPVSQMASSSPEQSEISSSATVNISTSGPPTPPVPTSQTPTQIVATPDAATPSSATPFAPAAAIPTPTAQTPVSVTPAVQTPVSVTPVAQTPVALKPVAQIPTKAMPAAPAPVIAMPVAQAPVQTLVPRAAAPEPAVSGPSRLGMVMSWGWRHIGRALFGRDGTVQAVDNVMEDAKQEMLAQQSAKKARELGAKLDQIEEHINVMSSVQRHAGRSRRQSTPGMPTPMRTPRHAFVPSTPARRESLTSTVQDHINDEYSELVSEERAMFEMAADTYVSWQYSAMEREARYKAIDRALRHLLREEIAATAEYNTLFEDPDFEDEEAPTNDHVSLVNASLLCAERLCDKLDADAQSPPDTAPASDEALCTPAELHDLDALYEATIDAAIDWSACRDVAAFDEAEHEFNEWFQRTMYARSTSLVACESARIELAILEEEQCADDAALQRSISDIQASLSSPPESDAMQPADSVARQADDLLTLVGQFDDVSESDWVSVHMPSISTSEFEAAFHNHSTDESHEFELAELAFADAMQEAFVLSANHFAHESHCDAMLRELEEEHVAEQSLCSKDITALENAAVSAEQELLEGCTVIENTTAFEPTMAVPDGSDIDATEARPLVDIDEEFDQVQNQIREAARMRDLSMCEERVLDSEFAYENAMQSAFLRGAEEFAQKTGVSLKLRDLTEQQGATEEDWKRQNADAAAMWAETETELEELLSAYDAAEAEELPIESGSTNVTETPQEADSAIEDVIMDDEISKIIEERNVIRCVERAELAELQFSNYMCQAMLLEAENRASKRYISSCLRELATEDCDASLELQIDLGGLEWEASNATKLWEKGIPQIPVVSYNSLLLEDIDDTFNDTDSEVLKTEAEIDCSYLQDYAELQVLRCVERAESSEHNYNKYMQVAHLRSADAFARERSASIHRRQLQDEQRATDAQFGRDIVRLGATLDRAHLTLSAAWDSVAMSQPTSNTQIEYSTIEDTATEKWWLSDEQMASEYQATCDLVAAHSESRVEESKLNYINHMQHIFVRDAESFAKKRNVAISLRELDSEADSARVRFDADMANLDALLTQSAGQRAAGDAAVVESDAAVSANVARLHEIMRRASLASTATLQSPPRTPMDAMSPGTPTDEAPVFTSTTSILRAVLMVMRLVSRSQESVTLVRSGMQIIRDLCAGEARCLGELIAVEDSVDIVSTCVQFYRDSDVIFNAGVAVLALLANDDAGARALRATDAAVDRLDKVARLVREQIDRSVRHHQRADKTKNIMDALRRRRGGTSKHTSLAEEVSNSRIAPHDADVRANSLNTLMDIVERSRQVPA